jgi:VIT1/CCC1 family predicted Fe2+/Mn2+ transporter
LSKLDWAGTARVLLLVFQSTFLVAVPFLFMQNARLAMRLSNEIAVVMLFITGVAYGRCVGRSPWGFGITMVILGAVLVALTMALGG